MLVNEKEFGEYPVPLYVIEEIVRKCYTTKQGEIVSESPSELVVRMRPLTLQEKAMHSLKEVHVRIVLSEQPDSTSVMYEAFAEHFPPSPSYPEWLMGKFLGEYQASVQGYANNWHSKLLREYHEK
jgi:hypothetical protein